MKWALLELDSEGCRCRLSEGRCIIVVENHTLTLTGPEGTGGRLPPAVVGSVLWQIAFLVRGSICMAFRRASRLRGRGPAWLRRAMDFRFLDHEKADSETTKLFFEAPRFGDAAEELYQQGLLFEQPPDQNDTGFDLFGDMLYDIANGAKDSERFDPSLLERFGKLERPVFKRGITSITVQGHRLPKAPPPRIDHELAERAVTLQRETPKSFRVRVMGKLDMIRDSDRVFGLILPGGEKVRGVWIGGDTELLGRFFRTQVVIDGKATFRPSGALLRVDTEGMAPATEKDSFFAKLPTALPSSSRPLVARVWTRQTSASGANAIYGQWPGDETEEEILAALGELD